MSEKSPELSDDIKFELARIEATNRAIQQARKDVEIRLRELIGFIPSGDFIQDAHLFLKITNRVDPEEKTPEGLKDSDKQKLKGYLEEIKEFQTNSLNPTHEYYRTWPDDDPDSKERNNFYRTLPRLEISVIDQILKEL